jgi:Cupin domain
MSSSGAIHIVSPAEFDRAAAQTPGSERRAAIAPALGIASTIWGGLFEVEPGSRTGIHHHGEQETIAYVLSGICEIRWGERGETVARAKAGDFIHVPLSRRIWKSILRTRSRFDGFSYKALQCPLSSIFLTTPGRKPDVSELRDGVWP